MKVLLIDILGDGGGLLAVVVGGETACGCDVFDGGGTRAPPPPPGSCNGEGLITGLVPLRGGLAESRFSSFTPTTEDEGEGAAAEDLTGEAGALRCCCCCCCPSVAAECSTFGWRRLVVGEVWSILPRESSSTICSWVLSSGLISLALARSFRASLFFSNSSWGLGFSCFLSERGDCSISFNTNSQLVPPCLCNS